MAANTDPALAMVVAQEEEKLIQYLKSQGKKDREIAEAYINLAERLQMVREYNLAHWLYKRVLKRKDLKDRVFVLSALALLDWRMEAHEEGLKHVQEGLALAKKQSPVPLNIATRLYYLKVKLSKKMVAEALSPEEQTLLAQTSTYNQDLFFHEAMVLLERKEYDQTLKLFGDKDIKNASPDEKLIYDFAKGLAKAGSKNLPTFYCTASLNDSGYLRGLSLAAKACPLLTNVIQGVGLDRQQVNNFKSQLKEEAPDLMSLAKNLDSFIR
jgi:hypothetical protein